MDLFTPVDQYCERLDASLLAEPLNLMTNLGFIIAAGLILRRQRNRRLDAMGGEKTLNILIFAIGLGSGLFHSYAIIGTKWCDVIPIGMFLLTYLWLFFRQVVGLAKGHAVLGLFAFLVTTGLAGSIADPVTSNGSQWYLGTWISLLAISAYYAGARKFRSHMKMALATALFSLSLIFRTIDMKVCHLVPSGTHFLWHLLNASVIYLATDAYQSQNTKISTHDPREG